MGLDRGSRKHILDWVETGRQPFIKSVNELLLGCDAQVEDGDCWMPTGRSSPQEAQLSRNGLGVLSKEVQRVLTQWWLAHPEGANTPNWDLALSASMEGQKGLVLVEAKAHEGELEKGPKRLSESSNQENHKRIGQAIDEARVALASVAPGCCISEVAYYQLSNRIAFAWKLAALGVPVVLMYLGFVNDQGLKPPLRRFEHQEHFDKVIRQYLSNVFPDTCIEKRLDCGAASMQVIARSRPVLSDSVPPANKSLQSMM